MRAVDPEVKAIVWAAIEPLVPVPVDTHPLGRHRRRKSGRDCFDVMLVRLVTGYSWEDAERLCPKSLGHHGAQAARRVDHRRRVRRRHRRSAGRVRQDDRPRPLHRLAPRLAPRSAGGGRGTGKNPTERSKPGWKWSILVDANGIPLGWVGDGANRKDSVLLAPTLDDAAEHGLLMNVETIWLDRGYDSEVTRQCLAEREINGAVIAKKRKRGSPEPKRSRPIGLRRPVERTNSSKGSEWWWGEPPAIRAWVALIGVVSKSLSSRTASRSSGAWSRPPPANGVDAGLLG